MCRESAQSLPSDSNVFVRHPKLPSKTPKSQGRGVLISHKERLSGETSLENVQISVEEFYKSGFLVVENAIPYNILDQLSQQMIKESEMSLA